MRITSEIFQVGGSSLSDPSDAASYLVTSNGSAALVDAGTGKGVKRMAENIRRAGVDPAAVKYLLLTHCHYDHTGGAEKVRELTGCSIVAHELDAKYLETGDPEVTAASWYGAKLAPLRIDTVVKGGSMDFTVGSLTLTMHHAPGHSPGSCVITVMSDGELVLFGQDVHGPLNSTLLSDRGDYIKSLEFMISLEADILCEGHFGIVRGRERVKEFISSYL